MCEASQALLPVTRVYPFQSRCLRNALFLVGSCGIRPVSRDFRVKPNGRSSSVEMSGFGRIWQGFSKNRGQGVTRHTHQS